MFCNIYLWFNLSTVSFFLCVFVFHSVLLLVNSTLVIFVVPYEYSFCLLVKGINLLGWFPFAMHRQSFPWFALDFSLSFFSLSSLSFFPSPNSWPLHMTKHNFGRKALGYKKGILSHGFNGKRTLIITPHWWMRSEEGPVKNNWMVQLGVWVQGRIAWGKNGVFVLV